jgi:hypothetical protein
MTQYRSSPPAGQEGDEVIGRFRPPELTRAAPSAEELADGPLRAPHGKESLHMYELDEQERPLTPVAAAAAGAVARARGEGSGVLVATLVVHASARGLGRALAPCPRHREPEMELPLAAIGLQRIELGSPGAPIRSERPMLLLAEELPACCRAAADTRGIARRFSPRDLAGFVESFNGPRGRGRILVAHGLRTELAPAFEAAGFDPSDLIARGVDLAGVAGYLWGEEIGAVRERDAGAEPLGLASLSGLGDRMGQRLEERLRASEIAFARLWGGLWSIASTVAA